MNMTYKIHIFENKRYIPVCFFYLYNISPGGGHDNPLQYSCLETPHGQRSLQGYSPLGPKEWDMTQQLSTSYSRFSVNIFE